jgi:hypothetical protein
MSTDLDWELAVNLATKAANNGNNLSALEPWQRSYLLLSMLIVEVCNGGFAQFLSKHVPSPGRPTRRDTLRVTARTLGAAVELHYWRRQRRDFLSDYNLEDQRIHLSIRKSCQSWQGLFQVPTCEEIALFDAPVVAPEIRKEPLTPH